MLKSCAPGHIVKYREHNIAVFYDGLVYPSIPRGKHGKRDNPTIQIGHIKSLVTHLKITADCANKVLPLLRLKVATSTSPTT